jgi:hypothetical protein
MPEPIWAPPLGSLKNTKASWRLPLTGRPFWLSWP